MILDNVFLDSTEYQLISKSNWPSYDELVRGKPIDDLEVKKDIEQYIESRIKKYWILQRADSIADGNRSCQNQVFYDKKVIEQSQCKIPWNTMGVNSYGDVFICASPAWIPKFVGNVLTATDVFEDILNSKTAQQIRQEILANRYYYCNNNICMHFNGKNKITKINKAPESLEDLTALEYASSPTTTIDTIPSNIIFDFDHTCNFVCPSCRTGLINNNKHSVISVVNQKITDKIKSLIIDNIQNRPTTIRWAGGEPFISAAYLDLLTYISSVNKPNIKHVIQTNGSYLKSKKQLLESLLPTIAELRISFDAATQDTYKKIRVNGVWDILIDNVKWLVELQKNNNYPVQITADFVVQKDNYIEIYEFYKLCTSLGIKNINFQRMWNWNTWDSETFKDKNVLDTTHPNYSHATELIRKVKNNQNENTK